MVKRRNRSQPIEIPYKDKRGRRKTPAQVTTLKIGEVAKKSKIPVVTLRFYENEGLIESFASAETNQSTHRRFSADVFFQLNLLRSCRSAGFSIPEIKELMQLYRGFKLPAKGKLTAIRRFIELIREQRKRLASIESVLNYRLRHPDADLSEIPIDLHEF